MSGVTIVSEPGCSATLLAYLFDSNIGIIVVIYERQELFCEWMQNVTNNDVRCVKFDV